MSDSGAPSELRGRYFVRSGAGLAYLRTLDFLLELRPARPRPASGEITRLLLGIGGHLGDAIIATSVLGAIARQHPEIEIGVVAPSWSRSILLGHPSVRWLHSIDHWKSNRSLTGVSRFWRFLQTRSTANREIEQVGYHAAIDLYPFYPNMALTFSRAGIPVRAAYDSGGGGPTLTHALPWSSPREHMSESQRKLAAVVLGELPPADRYDLSPVDAESERRAAALLGEAGVSRAFVVLHPGTGDRQKAWPLDSWLAVATAIEAQGLGVVVTGSGAVERDEARWLRMHRPAVVDLSGQTSIPELRAIMRRAALVIAPDSSAGHLAAAEGTPLVSIMCGPSDPTRWKPLANRSSIIQAGENPKRDISDVVSAARRISRLIDA